MERLAGAVPPQSGPSSQLQNVVKLEQELLRRR